MEAVVISTLGNNDLDSVAAVHLNAFSDRALSGLGREAVRRYYQWQLQGPHDAIAIGIYQGEKLAGFCFAGVYRGALSGFLRRNKWHLTLRVITHPRLILSPGFRERIGLALDVLGSRPVLQLSQPATHAKSFGVLAIAVDPQHQGTGLGKRLMVEVESIAAKRGFARLHLTVEVDNSRAIAFYQNLGWTKLPASDGAWRGQMVKSLAGNFE